MGLRSIHPLRSLRAARGLTQEHLAEVLQRDVSTIKRWEAGKTVPSARTQWEVARVLAVPMEHLGFGKAAVSVRSPEEGGLAGAEEVVELARRAERSVVGSGTIESIEQAVDRFSRSYATTSPLALLPAVTQRFRYVVGLLDQKLTLAQHRQLLVAGGWCALLLAALHFDVGQREAAQASRDAAHQLGKEGGHSGIAGWAFETGAWFALADGRYREAVDLARAGHAIADPGSAPRVAAMVQEARATARIGDRPGTEAALGRAELEIERMAPVQRPDSQFAFDLPKLSFYAATSWIWLNDPGRAADHANRVLRENGCAAGRNHWPTRVATMQVELGLAALQRDEVEEAVHLGSVALGGPFLRRSTIWRAEELDRGLLRAAPASRDVLDFHELLLLQRVAVEE